MERTKVYVEVNANHRPDGSCRPMSIKLEDGHRFEIERVQTACKMKTDQYGGTNIRYTIEVSGKSTFLYDEENGKWYVEWKGTRKGEKIENTLAKRY